MRERYIRTLVRTATVIVLAVGSVMLTFICSVAADGSTSSAANTVDPVNAVSAAVIAVGVGLFVFIRRKHG